MYEPDQHTAGAAFSSTENSHSENITVTRDFFVPAKSELRLFITPFPSSTDSAIANRKAHRQLTLKILPPPSGSGRATDEDSSSGTYAEIFGAQLATGVVYVLGGRRRPHGISVWVPHENGCVVQLTGTPKGPIRSAIVSTPLSGDVWSSAGLAGSNALSSLSAQSLRSTLLGGASGGGLSVPLPSQRWLVDLHHALNSRRRKAKDGAEDELGPRVLVLSSSRDSGKSTVCRVLSNYAQRSGYHPLLVNLDPSGAGIVGQPECIATSVAQHPIDAEEGTTFWPTLQHFVGGGSAVINSEMHVSLAAAGVWGGGRGGALDPVFGADVGRTRDAEEGSGSTSSRGDGLLAGYQAAVRNLFAVADLRGVYFLRTRVGGAIIDGPTIPPDLLLPDAGSADENSVGVSAAALTLAHTIEECGADYIIVLGSERLKHVISAAIRAARVERDGDGDDEEQQLRPLPEFLCFPRLDGAVTTTYVDQAAASSAAWREYFYGTGTSPLVPTTIEIPWDKCHLIRLVTRMSSAALDGLLPLTAGEEDKKEKSDHSSIGAPPEVRIISPQDIDARQRILGIPRVFLKSTRSAADEKDKGKKDKRKRNNEEEEECDFMDGMLDDQTYPGESEESKIQRLATDAAVVGFLLVTGMTSRGMTVLSPCSQLPVVNTQCLPSGSLPLIVMNSVLDNVVQ